MSNLALHQMITDALKGHVVGRKISWIEVSLPDMMKVALENNIIVTVKVIDIQMPEEKL